MSFKDMALKLRQDFDDVYEAAQLPLKYVSSLNGLFTGVVFPENTQIVLPISSENLVKGIENVFDDTKNVTKIKLLGSVVDDMELRYVGSFYGSKNLQIVDLSQLDKAIIVDFSGPFDNCESLKRIIGTLDFSNYWDYVYLYGVPSLEEIRVKEESLIMGIVAPDAAKLSTDSLQSIIDGLQTDSDGGYI